MKARVEALWKGPTQADLNLLEEYEELEAEAFEVFHQQYDEPVTHSVLQQSMEQLKREQNQFLSRLASQFKSARPAPPKEEVPKEPTTRELFEQFAALSQRFDNVEQFQLQTRRAAANEKEGF